MKAEADAIKKASRWLKERVDSLPAIGIVLGSGLGNLADKMQDKKEIPYGEIPFFPVSTVKGHEGKLIVGRLNRVPLVAMQGRIHYYEGFSIQEVVRPIQILANSGVETLILTNAAGGINQTFQPGSLMAIEDHIGLFCENPLRGENREWLGPRFPDMSQVYNAELLQTLQEVAREHSILLQRGVYAYAKGPSYETPAEIKLLSLLGADVVGMSTVPEAIAAAHAGLKIVALSCITNMAAGIQGIPLNHEEVIQTAEKTRDNFEKLVTALIDRIGGDSH